MKFALLQHQTYALMCCVAILDIGHVGYDANDDFLRIRNELSIIFCIAYNRRRAIAKYSHFPSKPAPPESIGVFNNIPNKAALPAPRLCPVIVIVSYLPVSICAFNTIIGHSDQNAANCI